MGAKHWALEQKYGPLFVLFDDSGLPTGSDGQTLRYTALGWIAAPITQPAWYVDATTGSDTNDGATPGTALQTIQELALRISGATITANTTITLAGDLSADPFELELTIGNGVLVTVQGAVTVTDSGTITNVVAAVPTTNTRGQITDDAQVFTDKSRLRLTGGAITGSIAYVTRVIAPTNVNVSAWALLSNLVSGQVPSIGVPSVGNSYDVETLTTTIGRVDVQVHGSGRLMFRDLVVTPATSAAHRATNDSLALGNVIFLGCRFGSAQIAAFYEAIVCFVSCAFDGVMVLAKSVATMRATTNRGVLKADLSSEVQFARSCNFDGGTLWVSGHSEATVTGAPGDLELSDIAADAAISIDPGSVVDANTQLTTTIWGADNNLEWAFLIRSGGSYTYAPATPPVLSGAGVADISLGGVNTSYAALPAINPANNAAAVERA